MTYTQAISKFSVTMRDQMRRNSDKRGWKEVCPEWAFQRAMEEMGELARSMFRKDPPSITQREAADVANFLMMLHVAKEKEKADAGGD